MYKYKIEEAKEYPNGTIVISFQWERSITKINSDILFVLGNTWSVRFDYESRGISSEIVELYTHIVALSRTQAFRLLYLKKE